jgi:hypothetical protein
MNIENALVRILNNKNIPIGVGFFTETGHVLTCAHVVAAAVGSAPESLLQMPTAEITLDFAFLPGSPRIKAAPTAWRPYHATRAGDIAVLRLKSPAPSNAQGAPIVIKSTLWKQPFRAYGVPAGYNAGVWSDGEIMGRQSNGYFQLEGVRGTGYAIQPGFSGGPIWADQYGAVVGMVTLSDATPNARTAFSIPSRMLLEVLDEALKNSGRSGQSSPQPVSLTTSAPASLGELLRFTVPQLQHAAQTYHTRAASPSADSEDILATGLIQLLMKQYAAADTTLTRFVGANPYHAYAHYALAIARLRGMRPAGINSANTAKTIEGFAYQAVNCDGQQAHFHILLSYIKSDYFMQWGFRVNPPDISICDGQARAGTTSADELDALAGLVTGIGQTTLWRACRQRV